LSRCNGHFTITVRNWTKMYRRMPEWIHMQIVTGKSYLSTELAEASSESPIRILEHIRGKTIDCPHQSIDQS
jgi:hypothetical protein